MPVGNTTPLIDVRRLGFRYGTIPVLEDVTFTVNAGEYLGVIGPNGGGKTTLIKILLGLLPPAEGSVKILGTDVREFRERYKIGYVPQQLAHAEFPFPATVREVVTSGRVPRVGMLRGFDRADRDAIARVMSVTEIRHLSERRLGDLSGGERQKVFIARALAGEPTVLILDEPTVGVDVAAQGRFYAFLADLNENHGITIIFVTHDIDIIAREARSVLCLNHGLICHGSPKDFIKEEFMERLYGRKMQFIHHGH